MTATNQDLNIRRWPGDTPAAALRSEAQVIQDNFVKLAAASPATVAEFGAIGDGVTDDSAAIQAAINAAAGGELFIPPGTYLINTTLVLPNGGNIALRGVLGQSILVAGPSLSASSRLLVSYSIAGTIDVFEHANVTIDGLTFDGADTTRTVSLVRLGKTARLRVSHCEFRDSPHGGLAIGGCRGIRVEACHFEGLGDPGVSISAGDALWIAEAGDVDTTQSTDVEVTGCTFRDLEWHGVSAYAQRVVIEGCTFVDTKESAIYVAHNPSGIADPARYAYSCTITGNHILRVEKKDVAAYGIECSAYNVVIANNHIEDTGAHGIQLNDLCKYVHVHHNTVFEAIQDSSFDASNQGAGIRLSATGDSALNPSDVLIESNRVRDDDGNASYAIIVAKYSGGATMNRVVVRGNQVTGGYLLAPLLLHDSPLGTDCAMSGALGPHWEVAATWTYSSDVAVVDFKDLGGYDELLVLIRDVTLSVSGQREVVVSIDNGSTFMNSSGDYINIASDGTTANAASAVTHATGSTAARSGTFSVVGMRTAALKFCRNHANNAVRLINTTSPLNAIRVKGSGGGNLTGGSIVVLAR